MLISLVARLYKYHFQFILFKQHKKALAWVEKTLATFNREKRIIEILEQHQGYCSVELFAKECEVSTMTIRRDLDRLKHKGLINKMHGGAVLNKFLQKEIPYDNRGDLNKDIKKSIALKASKFIEDDTTIMLDAGTTTLEIAYLLEDKKNITVITNDLTIAMYLSRIDTNVCIVGGFIENSTHCTSSVFSIEFLSSVKVDIAFIATTSINDHNECMVSTAEKAGVKKAMIASANKTVLVADDSKFGISSFCKVANMKDFTHIITNHTFDDKQKRAFENFGCSISYV